MFLRKVMRAVSIFYKVMHSCDVIHDQESMASEKGSFLKCFLDDELFQRHKKHFLGLLHHKKSSRKRERK